MVVAQEQRATCGFPATPQVGGERVAYLGRKGMLPKIMEELRNVSPEERPQFLEMMRKERQNQDQFLI